MNEATAPLVPRLYGLWLRELIDKRKAVLDPLALRARIKFLNILFE